MERPESANEAAIDFLVDRDDLHRVEFAPSSDAAAQLADGEVLLRIDRFGLTANNITYAVFGDAMNYWGFFPAPEGKGRIPAWGFADVERSNHGGIAEGERVFGYLPMSTHLVIAPDRISDRGFRDASQHRAELPGAYQLYTRTAGDSGLDPAHEDEHAIFRPLFVTSCLIEDFLDENEVFGARQVVLASASSKTALGVAFLLSQRRPAGVEVVALTSTGNAGFCEQTGYYDEVVAYDDLDSLASDVPTVLVDMAGDGDLLSRVHHHFGDALRHSCIVGATHWEEPRNTGAALPGAQPQFFFAPARIEQRAKDWGPNGLEERYSAAWGEFRPSVAGWLEVEHGAGPEAVEAAYREVLAGRVEPQRAHMLTLHES